MLLCILFWICMRKMLIDFNCRRGTSNFNVFSNQGIPGPKPTPFVGNAWGMWKKVTFLNYYTFHWIYVLYPPHVCLKSEYSRKRPENGKRIRERLRYIPRYITHFACQRHRNHQISFHQRFRSFCQPQGNIILNTQFKQLFIKHKYIFDQKAAFPEIKVLRYLLFGLENQKWKDIRSTVTPTFTTGKIKRVSQWYTS